MQKLRFRNEKEELAQLQYKKKNKAMRFKLEAVFAMARILTRHDQVNAHS